MNEIAIRCPKTGLPVRTGMLSTTTSFRAMAARMSLDECPACGEAHQWASRDAWLIDAEEAEQPPQIGAD